MRASATAYSEPTSQGSGKLQKCQSSPPAVATTILPTTPTLRCRKDGVVVQAGSDAFFVTL